MEQKNIKQEAVDYLSELMKSENKSPEMIVAIAELLKVVLD